jgi:hypothetical protein
VAHPYHHALSSVKRFSGTTDDYLELHCWFDATKAHVADARHRLLRHQSFGIFIAEQRFGVTLTTQTGHKIPTRTVAEQHVQEDFSFIPSVHQCFKNFVAPQWLTTNYEEDTPSNHARRSAARFGGEKEDYLAVHAFLETARLHLPSASHRVLLHTTLGIQTLEEIFGLDLLTRGGPVPTRFVAEIHIRADLGFIPTLEEALDTLPLEPWMYRGAEALTRKLGRTVPKRHPEELL